MNSGNQIAKKLGVVLLSLMLSLIAFSINL